MIRCLTLLLSLTFCQAFAQTLGTMHAKPLAPLANPADPSYPAKELFGRMTTGGEAKPHVYGAYSRGCMIGGEALEITNKQWQVMRLSRNRNWAQPEMLDMVEQFADRVTKTTKWHGILVGDMSQPRGGPMLTGHASHQIGLDADIWLTPMPSRVLTREERETMSAVMMVRPDRRDIDPATFTPDHVKVIKAASEHPRVERILVNAAIKKALCREATGDRRWLQKVRAEHGHDYHMHIRIGCPATSASCAPQAPVAAGEGCDLDHWFTEAILNPPKPKPPLKPYKPKPPMALSALPEACRGVLLAK
jgi:penicillin-insensitive murein DD-endopeptidase